jgi:microcin C transport system substrate-binding protein
MTYSFRSSLLWPLGAATLIFGACSKPAGPEVTSAPAAVAPAAFPGMEADLQRTLKEQSSFYIFKNASDLAQDTKGLTWEDGANEPEYGDPAAKRGGTLTLATQDFPGTFRWVGPDASDPFREFLLDYVAPVFVRPHPNLPGQYTPEVARAWAVDLAHKTVYFRLDPDARWSDGVPMTTADVVFSWYYYRSPLLEEPWFNDFYTKTYSAITVYDEHNFAVTLAELKPDLVDRAGDVNPLPKHFFNEFGPGWVQKYNWRITPTLGAYTIREEDIKRPSSITLSYVKNWWGQDKRFLRYRFNPDRIHLTVIRDPDKTIEAFLRGDIDDLPVVSPQTWYEKLSSDHPAVASGFTVKATFYNQIPPPNFGLWINEAQPLLGDRNVRLGIQYASNFKLVCQQYFRGDAAIQKTASDGYGWDPNPDLKPRPFDPAKAREFFAKAGFTQQGPDGVLTNPQGQRLSFTVTTIYRRFQDVLVVLKQEALKAGLEFNLEVLDQTTGSQKMEEKKCEITLTAYNRSVEMYPRYWECYSGVNAYDVPYLADGSPNPNRKVKTNTNNLSSIAIPALDELIKQYDKAETMEQTKTLAAKIEQMLYDDAGWVNGWKIPHYWAAYRPWIKWPADFNVMQSRDEWEFWLMWIDQDAQKAALEAKAAGRSLPRQSPIYDRFKEP